MGGLLSGAWMAAHCLIDSAENGAPMLEFEVELLADHPSALPGLARWFEREWAPYYGPDGPGDATADLRDSCNRTALPIALVATLDGEVVGTAALKAESVSTHRHLTPWLAALLVLPAYRRRGIAERLIGAVEYKARELGFHTIHVGIGEGSGTPATALSRRGWQFVERGPFFVSEVSIFRKEL